MADDTRQSTGDDKDQSPGQMTDVPQWAAWNHTPVQPAKQSSPDAVDTISNGAAKTTAKREIVNEMPGGTANTAGGEKIEDYSFFSILKSIRPSEYQHFHHLPCVRDAMLTGIGCGFGAGGLAFVLGSKFLHFSLFVQGADTLCRSYLDSVQLVSLLIHGCICGYVRILQKTDTEGEARYEKGRGGHGREADGER